MGFGEALLLSILGALAYYQIFSTFAPVDDEGHMMLTVKHFLADHRLYDEVWALYGPVYFFYKWLIHGLCGLPLTHDVVRFTAMAGWLLIGVVAAVSAFGLTGSLTLAAVAQMLVTLHLWSIIEGPGHPQELGGLLTMAIVGVASISRHKRPGRTIVTIGLLVAALSMVKVNLGTFAALGVWMALLSLVPLTAVSLALRIVSSAALLALPLVFMRSMLEHPEGQRFAAIELMSIAAVSTITLTRRDGTLRMSDLVAFALSCIGGIALILLATVARGTTLAALVDCLIIAPSRLRPFVHMQAEYFLSPIAAAAAVALAVSVRATRRLRASPYVLGVAKLAFGIAALDAWWRYHVPLLVSWLTPFLWLAVMPPKDVEEDAPRELARHVLCWVAVLLPLQAYPITGSQVYFGTVLHVLVGVVCIADGLRCLRSRSTVLARRELRVAVAGSVLVVVMGCSVWQMRRWRQAYSALVPVDLPGATRLHLPRSMVETLRALTQTLRERADTFLCVPGFSSLYFWTGKDPPTLDVFDNDMNFYSEERPGAMQSALSALLEHRSPVIVHFRGLFLPYPPVEERLRQDFKPLTQIGGYQLLVPR